MKCIAFMLALLTGVPRAATAQAGPAEVGTTGAPAPTLVIMAAGSNEHRSALNPAIDSLCREFEADPGPYRDVVRLQSETDLSAVQRELTPKDNRAQKGAVIRRLQGGLDAQAFLSCRDGSVPDNLPEPLEVVVFGVSFARENRVNVSVSRYHVGEPVSRIGQPYNAHVDLFVDVELLGRCVGEEFWKHAGVRAGECDQRIGFDPATVGALPPEGAGSEHPLPVITTAPDPTSEKVAKNAGKREASPRATRNPTWLWLGGAGAVVGVASLPTWLIADAKTRALKRDCSAHGTCADFASRRRGVETFDVLTNVLLVTGSLTVLAAASLYLLDTEAQPPPAGLSFEVAPGMWGVVHRSRF